MKVNLNDQSPIFIQIADIIKDAIIEGVIQEGEKIPSTTELSNFYQINRATAQKSVGILVDEGIAEKRRGIGVFAVPDAREKLMNARVKGFADAYIKLMVAEVKRLEISKEEVIRKVSEYYDNH